MKEHEFKIKLKRRDMNQIIASLGALPTVEDKKLVKKLRQVLKSQSTREYNEIKRVERFIDTLKNFPERYSPLLLQQNELYLEKIKSEYLTNN